MAAQDQIIKDSLSLIKNKFMVMSGKGGVGKTSVAANLAMALSKQGARVGLMDVDLHGPDIPRILGLKRVLEASVEGSEKHVNDIEIGKGYKSGKDIVRVVVGHDTVHPNRLYDYCFYCGGSHC